MKYYTIYKTATGLIEQTIATNADIDECITKDDETIVEGEYSASKYKFINGEPVEQEIIINNNKKDL
tara:strand:- start:2902 stop:3102 length:201 start_codon:yes stop_codon:yes gene_type:complete